MENQGNLLDKSKLDICDLIAKSKFRFSSSYTSDSARRVEENNSGLKMQLKWSAPTSSGPPMIIDRAPSKERPFANILNPYDHACSVLCNHPIGEGRLSWFARKFVMMSRVFGRKDRTTVEERPVSVPEDFSGERQKFPKIEGTDPMANREGPAAKRLNEHLQKTGSLKIKRRTSTKESGKVLPRKATDKSKGKSRKGKKKKTSKKGKKKSKKKTVDTEEGMSTGTKKRGKSKQKRSDFPVSLEDVENPLTLVENGATTKDARSPGRPFADFGSIAMDYKNIPIGEGGLAWNDEIRASLQKELDQELAGSEFDPRRLQELQDLLQSNADKSQVSSEIQNISDEISKKNLRSDSWMHYPRVPSIRCCRFELPMDAQILTVISPAKYLSGYCIVPRKRRHLLSKVFTKNRGVDNVMSFENIPKALNDVFGRPVDSETLRAIYGLARLDADSKLELATFVGVAALAERYLYIGRKNLQDIIIAEEEAKDTIEEMDFANLSTYLEGIHIEQPINDLLTWIQQS